MNNDERRQMLPQEVQGQTEEVEAPSSLLERFDRLRGNQDPQALEVHDHTEIIELPSRGLWYPPEHPLHMKETIEIKHPTLKQQNILNKKSLIKEGVVFDRALQPLIVNPLIKINSLLLGDREKLLIEMRRMMRGELYHAKVFCPSCGTESKVEYNIETQGTKDTCRTAEELRKYGIEVRNSGGVNTFLVELPETHFIAEFKLLTGEDEKRMLAEEKAQQKLVKEGYIKKGEEEELQIRLRKIIVSVQGVRDPDILNPFINKMRTPDPEYLLEMYDLAAPNAELAIPFKCNVEGCEHESEDLLVPIDINFFWGRRRMHS